jgi:hypothetical protein
MQVNLDLARLKALPKRIKMVGLVLAVELTVLLSGYLLLDDMMADRVSHVSQLRGSLLQLRHRNEQLRSDLNRYPELRRRYDEALAAGLGNPLDRPGLIAFAKDSSDRHRLSDLRYRLAGDGAKPVSSPKYVVENDEVEFEFGALLDDDVRAFWTDLAAQQPGHFRLVSFELTRQHDPDDSVLTALRRGSFPALLQGKLTLRWTGVQPNLQAVQ